ncbi:MAG: universal stress protein, partial [Actinobacteria bacterium]|nr:universal stress protein [Actinomycetota bacterium]
MGVYERILVPVEGTETDGPVLDHIAEVAAMCGAEVTLLRVA